MNVKGGKEIEKRGRKGEGKIMWKECERTGGKGIEKKGRKWEVEEEEGKNNVERSQDKRKILPWQNIT